MIYCSQINQIKHLKNRNINDDELIKINQNFDIDNKKKKADYIIDNNGSIDDLKNKLIALKRDLKHELLQKLLYTLPSGLVLFIHY